MLRYLYLRITGSNLAKEEITKSLGLKPTLFNKKGETHLTQLGKSIAYTEDCWQNEKSIKKQGNLELDILKYIKILIDKKHIIEYYKKNSSVQLGLMMYSKDYQNTFIISQELREMLNLVDVDFYITIANL